MAILDCPVSNMKYMIEQQLKEMNTGLPTDYMLFTGNIVNKIKLGFAYNDVDVTKYTSKTEVPVLIFNSKADTLTPYFMGENIYNSISHNNRKLVTVDDSRHANIYLDHKDKYTDEISNFISSLNL